MFSIPYCIFFIALVSGARHPRHADSCSVKTTAKPAPVPADIAAIEWVYVTEYTTVYPTSSGAPTSSLNAEHSSKKQYSSIGSSSTVSREVFLQYGSGFPSPTPTSALYNSGSSISVAPSEKKHTIATGSIGGSFLVATTVLSQYSSNLSLSVSPLKSVWEDVPIHGPAPRASSSIMYSNTSLVDLVPSSTTSSSPSSTPMSVTMNLSSSSSQQASRVLLTYDPFKGRTTLKITTPPWRTALANSLSLAAPASSAPYASSVSSSRYPAISDTKPQLSSGLSSALTTASMSPQSTPQIIVPVTLTPSSAAHNVLPRATMTLSRQSAGRKTSFRVWKRDETSTEDDKDGTDALHSETDDSDQYSTTTITTTQRTTIQTDRLPASTSLSQSHARRSSVKPTRTSAVQSKTSTRTRTTQTVSPTTDSGLQSGMGTFAAGDVLCLYYPYPHCKTQPTLRDGPSTTQEEEKPESSGWCPYPNQVC